MDQETKQRPQPVKKIKLPQSGSILWVAIWQHQNSEGRSTFSVSFSRSYRKKEGDKKYVATQYYGRDHLLALARAMEEAHRWILATEQKESVSSKEAK